MVDLEFTAAAAKSLQSCLTLCDPMTAAHQAPPSLGFSRQEYWSGVPLPSPRIYNIYKIIYYRSTILKSFYNSMLSIPSFHFLCCDCHIFYFYEFCKYTMHCYYFCFRESFLCYDQLKNKRRQPLSSCGGQ